MCVKPRCNYNMVHVDVPRCTSSYVRCTYVHACTYGGTYTCTYHWLESCDITLLQVQVYHTGMVPKRYTCMDPHTNITFSQKQLEIQALRCNGHVYVLEYHGTYTCTYVPWYVPFLVRTHVLRTMVRTRVRARV